MDKRPRSRLGIRYQLQILYLLFYSLSMFL